MHRIGETQQRALRVLATTLVISAAIVGCSDQTTAPERALSGPSLTLTRDATQYMAMNTPSDQLAQLIPGFGGAFVENGMLNVLVTQPVLANSHAQANARSAIRQLFASAGRPEIPVKFVLAKHSFAQLRVWETALRVLYPKLGVHQAGIDERNNRLDLVVRDRGNLSALASQLVTLGVPIGAAVTRVGPEGRAYVTLSDKVRPTRGGLYILTLFRYASVDYRFGCTYGFNTLINSVRYMVTNAHCVEPPTSWGGLIGAQVAQPDSNSSSLVGTVVKNPASFVGTGCAPGNTCRYSDAVLVNTTGLVSTNWDLGGIARTIT